VQGVQRIMLTASRSESIGKTDEVLLVDGLQYCRNRLLDDLVLYTQDGERPLRSVRLRDVDPSGRAGAVAAFVDVVVQIRQFLFEVVSVGLPRHAVDAWR
jgi:hypothetical protein